MNENEEIRIQNFVFSTEDSYVEAALKAMFKTATDLGYSLPEVVFTDKCCSDRAMLENIFPSLLVGLNRPPPLKLPEELKVNYIRNPQDLNTMTARIYHLSGVQLTPTITSQDQSQQVRLHLDAEWPVGGNIALIQIGVENKDLPEGLEIFLFHIARFSEFPAELSTLLQDERFKFVGRNIRGDATRLENQFNVVIKNSSLQDLKEIRKDYRSDSLSGLTTEATNRALPKENEIRKSNWARSTLSSKQREYAALDIFASFSIVQSKEHHNPPLKGTPTRVKLDPFHWFQRLEIPKKHAFQHLFWQSLRDAVFMHHPRDVEKVESVLRSKGLSFKEQYERNPSWILKRVRRKIPPPELLEKRIDAVVDRFKDDKYKDPSTKKPLLSKEALASIKDQMDHVKKGCLSDIEGFSLYYIKGYDSEKLPLYRCIRGTNDLEGGVHQKLREKFRYWGIGLDYADVVLAFLRHRHNVRASARHRKGFRFVGHYRYDYIDLVQRLAKEAGFDEYPWWRNTSDCPVTEERFGIVPIVPLEKQEDVEYESLRKDYNYSSTMAYVCVNQKTTIPYFTVHTPKEKDLFKR
jgi:hypothetical protein